MTTPHRLASRVLADATLTFHFLFVIFALLGGFLVPVVPLIVWPHLASVLWSSIVNLFDWTCPLTPAEKRFRAASGGSAYQGGFVQHYVGRLVYPLGMPRRLELVAGISILVWNALVYGALYVFVWRNPAGA